MKRQDGVFIPLTVNNLLPSVDEAGVVAIYFDGIIYTYTNIYTHTELYRAT